MPSQNYDRLIQFARVATAVAFTGSALGMVVFANVRFREGAVLCSVVAGASLLCVPLLVIEQLIAASVSRRWRFTLGFLMLLTAAVGVLFAVLRWNVFAGTILAVLYVLGAAGAVESWRKPK
jgi:hypothetical protein